MPPTVPPEPTFTLRGRDAGAADALAQYAQTAKDLGADAAEVARIRKAAEEFRAYPVKIPAGREPQGSVPGSPVMAKESTAEDDE